MASTAKLRRYMITVTKNSSPIDPRQIPADATVTPYRQGATVKTGVTILAGQTVEVEVYDVGAFEVLNQAQVNAGGPLLSVVDIPDRNHIGLMILSGGSIVEILPGDRLWNLSNQPQGYGESTGTAAIVFPRTDSTGTLQPAYLKERFFDATVTSNVQPSFPVRRLIDQSSGGASFVEVFDIRDYGARTSGDCTAAIQRVLDLIGTSGFPFGGIVYIPRGEWKISSVKVRSGRVTIQGEGLDSRLVGTSKDLTMIELQGDNIDGLGVHDFVMRDVLLLGANEVGVGNGVECVGVNNYRPSGFLFEHVQVFNMPADALRMTRCDFPLFIGCSFALSKRSGIVLSEVAQASFYQCYSQRNYQYGLYAEFSDVYWQGIAVENNALDVAMDPVRGGQMLLKECRSCVVTRTDFENFGTIGEPELDRAAKNGLVIEASNGVVVSGCTFFPAGTASNESVGVRIVGIAQAPDSPKRARGIQVVGNQFTEIGRGVKIENVDSCVGVMLGPNSAPHAGSAPSAFNLYEYPKGAAAEGLRITVFGDCEDRDDLSVGQLGLGLPVAGGSVPLMDASAGTNEGMVLYDATALRGQRLKLSDGVSWYPVGGALAVTGTRPSANTFGNGTLIFRNDVGLADQNRLEASINGNWYRVGLTLSP